MNSSSIFSQQTSTKLRQSLRRLTKKFKKTEEQKNNPQKILDGLHVIQEKPIQKYHKSVQLKSKSEQGDEDENKMNKMSLKISVSKNESPKKQNVSGIEVQEDVQLYKKWKWEKMKLIITKERIVFNEGSNTFNDVDAIRIERGNSKTQASRVIRLKMKNNLSILNIPYVKKTKNLPLPYLIFALIVERKIVSNNIKKMKWEKSYHIEPTVVLDSYIFGKIYKRSKYLKEWNQRYIVIKKEGLFSYQQPNKQINHSFFMQSSSVRYVDIQFDFINDFLILKVRHNLNKTEFGIPVVDFLNKGPSNWLFEFFRMIS